MPWTPAGGALLLDRAPTPGNYAVWTLAGLPPEKQSQALILQVSLPASCPGHTPAEKEGTGNGQ